MTIYGFSSGASPPAPRLGPIGVDPNVSLAPGKCGNNRLPVPNCRITSAKLADTAKRPWAKADHVLVPRTLPQTNSAITEGQAISIAKPSLPPKRGGKEVQG